MFGALLGAGASILGGLFGSKKQKTETTIDYQKMARNAQAAGFNPLTALRNGGSAGFTSTVHHPGLSGLGDAIANVGNSFGAALDKRIDPIEQKRDKVESALLDYQLATIQAGPKPVQSFGSVPTKKGNPLLLQTVPPMATQKAVRNGSAIPKMAFKAGDNPTVSTVGLEDRYGITPDPFTADAAAWEQRYAEPGEWVGGIYVMGADAIYNAKRGLDNAVKAFKEPKPLPEDSYLRQGARWLDKSLGLEKPKKGGRVAPPSTW